MDITRTVRDGFLTGLIVIGPLAITIAVLSFLYGQLAAFVASLLDMAGVASTPVITVLALAVLVVAVVVIGVVVRQGLVGGYLITGFDHVMEAIPVVQAIYTAARQASNALIGHESQFERVVLVEWPRKGVFTIGFVTDDTPAKLVTELEDEPHYNVFIPMSPNPMGGFLAIVPEDRLTKTDLSVRRALQMVITTGMSSENELSIDDLRTI